MEVDVHEALELASGSRLKIGGAGLNGRTTVNHHEISITRKTILLFLESLDPEMTVAELRDHLDQ
ncbi:hypothetical protein DTW90_34620 [Neorhizobium sp. P12A]|uniref:hypothetical protein n=1 Tax=Neorhizobium sp. P12A TaxID=2268027 RepID=UPI0011EC93FD|nr:hypothetical protein [Neorhizobium sp. P12A]KAA0686022.1 hypothetical protein DTW90_34620 [Neorhizobium sp. P12A]